MSTTEIVLGIATSLIATELYAFLPRITDWLLRFHARRLPSALSARMLEEWRALVLDTPGRITAFLRALDLFRATGRITHDHLLIEHGVHLDRRALIAKRVVDVAFSAAALVVLAPLLILVVVAIKLDSRGPILRRTSRVGLYGKTFSLLTFRTMLQSEDRHRTGDSTEPARPAAWPAGSVSWVGRFLRKYSLDELPQLINILLGHMSLVGPRPPLPREVLSYQQWQYRRFAVRPGLTCLWQVSPDRYRISFNDWMELDLKYVDHFSLRLDLVLLVRTFLVVLTMGDDNE